MILKKRRFFAIKRPKFTDEQIAFALKQAETGTKVGEVCRKKVISDSTFYNWKNKYAGLGVSELRRLKQLEEEKRQLKRLVALNESKTTMGRSLYQKIWTNGLRSIKLS